MSTTIRVCCAVSSPAWHSPVVATVTPVLRDGLGNLAEVTQQLSGHRLRPGAGGTFLLNTGGWPLLHLRLTSAIRAEAEEAVAPAPSPEPKVPREGAGIPPVTWVFKAYAPSRGKAMCPLTGLWALAMLSLPTSHPPQSSSLELLGKQQVGMLGMGEEPGILYEPRVFDERYPMHTELSSHHPLPCKGEPGSREPEAGQAWHLLST